MSSPTIGFTTKVNEFEYVYWTDSLMTVVESLCLLQHVFSMKADEDASWNVS